MMEERPIDYRTALATAGAMLDELEASDIALIETDVGFEVRFEAAGEMRRERLNYPDLLVRAAGLQERRPRPDGRGRYYRLLEALGTELDEVHAYTMLLEELEDSFAVSYQFDDPVEGYMLKKQLLLLDDDAQLELLSKVQGQRKSTRGPRWRLLG